ncbi:alpha/beta hydrolase-fold protein [Pedobacter gandavensis]|uniref:alpha/beta hydrolase-fold protein n=1 Tax=Pedobacter gandavensis TaxID=2679963 RepID=UPI00292E7A1B|nr:alpha/beta hydrolase-fold protein [Pedobacter gandavensis]
MKRFQLFILLICLANFCRAQDISRENSRSKDSIYAVLKKVDSLLRYQASLEKQGLLHQLPIHGNALSLYHAIKTYNHFPPIAKEYISMQFKLNDSLHTAFLIALPKDYDPKRKYPLLFFLHGGVRGSTDYPDYIKERDPAGWNRFYTKYATENQVIMVYPMGNKAYNWMVPDQGFYMIPAILKQIKSTVNVDDDRVFISGHSNGATGSFSYAMKQPSPFTGFYGFNTRPEVATGGTYIRNILNRSFFNVSTDEDYYYPPAAHDSLNKVMKALHADYQDHRYNGFPHWFPAFAASEPAYQLLFADLIKRKRNAFKPAIQWETDDTKYGRCDWLNITSLDTLAANAVWQKPINFKINKWVKLDKDDEAIFVDTVKNAFNYAKRSGAVKANYANNIFRITTSRVNGLKLYISPEMVDLQKPVTIILNDQLYFKGKINYDKDFMVREFIDSMDRSAIWVNAIDIRLPKE